MNRTSIYAALALLAFAAAPAGAQGREPVVLPPHEIVTIISSTQFEPIGQPMRRGPNYLLRALDQDDREVTLTINARSGHIMAVTPMQTASRMPPSVLPAGSMGEWQRMPPGYVPPGYRPGAPIIVEDDEDLPPRQYGARPPASVPSAPLPRAGQPSAPVASATPPDDDDVQQRPGTAGPTVIPADPDRSGLLPPPPERFPQRVAPAPPPKPVQRSAAAPPRPAAPASAPLPRPKPAAPAAAAPSAPAPQPTPANTPADDTPH